MNSFMSGNHQQLSFSGQKSRKLINKCDIISLITLTMKNQEQAIFSHSAPPFRFQNSSPDPVVNRQAGLEMSGSQYYCQSQTENRTAIIELEQKIIELENKVAQFESVISPKEKKKKKLRRKAKQIPRIFQCQIQSCGKVYGSQTSLKNHQKLKHGIRLIRKSKRIESEEEEGEKSEKMEQNY